MNVNTTVILDGETPEALSARLHAPVCMILRANWLVSALWLLPGREIVVPQADLCKNSAFPCPVRLMDLPAKEERTEVCIAAEGDTIGSLALALGTTERLLLLARGHFAPLREGERITISANVCKKRIGSVLLCESMDSFCARHGIDDKSAVMRLNGLKSERLWPGMRILLP